ncbi:MAG: M20/M25/M40 family metallo-hydrolase [Patescibacteria group bacterium]|nr:M20/M25/M40 family metallo-hydrolase [Patescibacteria group bacterium]
MRDEIIALASRLIEIPSVEQSQKDRDQSLETVLSFLSDFTIERFTSNGVASALVYTGKQRPSKFHILLNGHLDVVPGKEENYRPRIDGDKLYGVGSLDMKGSVATLVYVFREIAHRVKYPLGLQLVTDEEVGGFHGTKWQIEQGVRADFVICGEPTNFDIVNKAKGILWLNIITKGITAHGAYPWRGKNAILVMQEFLQNLLKAFPIPQTEAWKTTVNVAMIESPNTAYNKIPDECAARLDIRFVPEDKDHVLQTIQTMLPPDAVMEIVVNEPALYTSEQDPILQRLQQSIETIMKTPAVVRGANGSSDARHYMTVGCPGIEFGPTGADIGGDHEWVSIRSLEQYYHLLCDFLMRV